MTSSKNDSVLLAMLGIDNSCIMELKESHDNRIDIYTSTVSKHSNNMTCMLANTQL